MRPLALLALIACDGKGGTTPPPDDDTFDGDRDDDGFPTPGDCDDYDPDVHPGAIDAPYDGLDADCADDSDYDADRDGVDSADHGGLDCDDADPAVLPDAEELC